MPRSYEDYGILQSVVGGSQLDNVELVYQLSGVPLIDGLGRTYLFTTFDEGIHGWRQASDYGLYRVRLRGYGLQGGDNVISRHAVAEFSVNGAGGHYIDMYREYVLLRASRTGVECGWVYDYNSMITQVGLTFRPSGYDARRGKLQYNAYTGDVDIGTSSGWVTVFNYPISYGLIRNRVQYKFVYDITLDKYVRLIFNDYQIDLSSYSLEHAVDISLGYFQIYFHVTSSGSSVNNVWLTYLRVTKDEP